MPYDIKLKGGFDQQPELYDRARPHYPDALFEALIEQTGIQRGSKLLEIGPGPGTATLPLAEEGYEITAVERGPAMAKTAMNNLAKYPKVRVITGEFEDVDLPSENFDLIYSATAFHWLDPEVSFKKSHQLLKAGGHLAITNTNYLSDDKGDAFYESTKPIYEEYAPGTNINKANQTGKTREDLPTKGDIVSYEFDPELFKPIFFEVFRFSQDFKAREYVDLLGTFSTNLDLSDVTRKKFFAEMFDLVEEQPFGRVTLNYGMSLSIAELL